MVCHTMFKPATVPEGWVEAVTAEARPWGTIYLPRYNHVASGVVQSAPPPGTASFAARLAALGHTGVGKANVFFSHAWKVKYLDVVKCMRSFGDKNRALPAGDPAKIEGPILFWFDCVVVDEVRCYCCCCPRCYPRC